MLRQLCRQVHLHQRPGADRAGPDAARRTTPARELRRIIGELPSMKNFTAVSAPEANRVRMPFASTPDEISLRRIFRRSRVGTGVLMAKIDKLAIAQKIVVRVLLVLVCIASSEARAAEGTSGATTTPIRHLIVIVGENHTFDNLFGIYQPVSGQTVSNLLSEGIINPDGTPGPHFSKAQQWQASVTHKYSIAPQRTQPLVC